nr:MAG TPA: hypothetical protein [Caudoviricetes sp.]
MTKVKESNSLTGFTVDVDNNTLDAQDAQWIAMGV